jgi:DNA-3-methyladenine glycosylase I
VRAHALQPHIRLVMELTDSRALFVCRPKGLTASTPAALNERKVQAPRRYEALAVSEFRPVKRRRCAWAESDIAMQRYHDREWGVPVHSDRRLFEFLILEGAQAGLSWSTILGKRPGYRRAFSNFDIAAVARFNSGDVRRLLKDPNIVRNRLKIKSAIKNAKAALAIRAQFGSLNRFLWQFVRDVSARKKWTVRVRSKESDAMSAALRDAGFSFVGTTICYAFMQAVGMVNDHIPACFRRREVDRLRLRGRARS